MTAAPHENRDAAVGYSAFLSHASEDRQTAEAVCRHLEAAGFRCWIAPRDVRPGKDYPEEIIRGIEESKCLVLILSEVSNKAPFVRAEVERAYSKGKPVFPVRIQEVLPSRALELFISTKHWIDAWQGNIEQHAARLAQELARDPDLDFDLSPELVRRVKLRRLLRWGIGGVGAAAIAVLVALIMRPAHEEFDLGPGTPPGPYFFGGQIYEGKPIKASFMINDGYTGEGKYYRVFEKDMTFEVFRAFDDAPAVRIYAADPDLFKGQYQSTATHHFTIEELPMRVVSCMRYKTADDRREAAVTGFNFESPERAVATFTTKAAGPTKTYADENGAGCSDFVADYARTELVNRPMASKAEPPVSLSELVPTVTVRYGTWQVVFGPEEVLYRLGNVEWSLDGARYQRLQTDGIRIPTEPRPAKDQVLLRRLNSKGEVSDQVTVTVRLTGAIIDDTMARFKANTGDFLTCTVFGCTVTGNLCAPYVTSIKLGQDAQRLVDAGAPPACRDAESLAMPGQCITAPKPLGKVAPGKPLHVEIEFADQRVLRGEIPLGEFRLGDSQMPSGGWDAGWTELVSEQPDAPYTLARFDGKTIAFAMIIGVDPDVTHECPYGNNFQVTYDLDGRGLVDRQIYARNAVFELPVPLKSIGGSIALQATSIGEFGRSEPQAYGPYRFALDVKALILKAGAAGPTPRLQCRTVNSIEGRKVRNCEPPPDVSVLAWMPVKELQYGPAPDAMSESRPIAIDAELIIAGETMVAKAIPKLDIDAAWPDLFYRFIRRDGSPTDTVRLSFQPVQ
jgi:hypothetical protein